MQDDKDKVKGDLHVHIDGCATKDCLIKCLQEAEKQGLKKVCFLEHDKLNAPNILEEISKIDGIKKYYSGQIVLGVEFSTILDSDHTNPDNTNYAGYVSHILVYMPLEEAKVLNKNKILLDRNKSADYVVDYQKLMSRIKCADESLEIPSIEELKAIGAPHIVKDLREWILKDEERKIAYKKALNITDAQFSNASTFIRQLAECPKGILYYKPEGLSYLTQTINIIRKQAPRTKIVVAHPAYMSADFKTEYYLQTLMSIPQIGDKPNFDGIEVGYMLNKPQETEYLEDYAKKRKLLKTCGTDVVVSYREMFFDCDGDRYYYVPKLGWPVGMAFYNKNILINKDGEKNILKIKNENDVYMLDKTLFNDIVADFDNLIAQKDKKVGILRIDAKMEK